MSQQPQLPEAALLALWFTAWARAGTSLDGVRDAVVGADAEHQVVGLPDDPAPAPLILAVGRLRGAGATGAALALPVPGDPLGLAGPPAFNAAALEAGQAVLFPGSGWGVVPVRDGPRVVWHGRAATLPGAQPDFGEADRQLRHEVVVAADRLADLDVARWRPEAADLMLGLESEADVPYPPDTGQRAVRLATLASRCRSVVDLALTDDGAAWSASEAEQRRTALLPLERAARRGLVAACCAASG